MKKFIYLIFLIFIFLLVLGIFYLSSIGLETSRFNNLIIKEIRDKDPNIQLELKKIKIKLDLKKIELYISTNNPKIIFQNTNIPITNIKIYSKINKIFNSKIEISQIIFAVEKFKTLDIQKAAIRIKPSNLKNYLLNNLEGGQIEKALFDLNLDKNFNLISYKAKGSIKKINLKVKKSFVVKDMSFNFIADRDLTLINSLNAKYKDILVENGSIDLTKKKNIEIKGKFNSQFNLNESQLKQFFIKENFFFKNKIETEGSVLHEFDIIINNNFKIIDYNFKSSGKILKSKIILKNIFKNKLIDKPIKKILFEEIKLKINFNKSNKNLLMLDGFYSTDGSNYKKFKIKNNLKKNNQNYLIDLNLSENFFFDVINFRIDANKTTNIKSEIGIKNNKFIFKSLDLTEGKNFLSIKGLVLSRKNEVKKIESIELITFAKNKENNNFKIDFKKKIIISGKKYDSTNLLKILSQDNNSKLLKNFNSEIEVKLKDVVTKSQIPLKNLNLLGKIEKGKFTKISAKSEFSKDKYFDVSLTKNSNNKKILEVYSDLPQALLADYKFFEGIKGGKLLYSSLISESGSNSKLVIENFKVNKAPAFATLLTLADLSGIADLLSGQGMSFDILEIKFKDDDNVTVVEEILALGSSVSLHMDGYIEKKTGLLSLSGTMVPAKTLNRLVSKIPVVGNILVGNKVGEGVFGVSFKIKGMPGKIKTTVNPVKTITPRFITRALEKMKKN
jgi:hypothetical protein